MLRFSGLGSQLYLNLFKNVFTRRFYHIFVASKYPPKQTSSLPCVKSKLCYTLYTHKAFRFAHKTPPLFSAYAPYLHICQL